ncbi:MAG: hypothetical protein JWL62_3834 [Hyphomicrobiales bacterium]|nr:hypothetical protein [Hyphomicrobiales bacterium]
MALAAMRITRLGYTYRGHLYLQTTNLTLDLESFL